jgi:predicted permease
MHIFLVSFQAVAALLGIGVIGFWIIGRRHMPATTLTLLNSIAIDITIPCLALGNILTKFSPRQLPGWWHMPLWWLGFTAVTLVLSLASSLLTKKEFRGEFAMSLLFQNGIFFPLLIIAGLFPGQEADYVVLLFLFIFLQPSLIFGTYALFFRRKSKTPTLNVRRIVNPVLAVTIVGIACGLAGVNQDIPPFLIMVLTLIGGMAIPIFMLILGGNIYNDLVIRRAEGNRIYAVEVIKFTLIKMVLFPMVFLGLLILIRPDYPVAFIIVLEAALPPITAIPILTERGGGNRTIASQFILATFVFSTVSIPAVIYVFSLFFPFSI